MTAPWLTLIGIGEDGRDGLSPAALRIIDRAGFIMGGERHLDLIEKIDSETHEVDIAPPIGKFVTDNLPIEKRVVTANGMYIHFTDVCSLIKKFSVLKNYLKK